METIELVAAKFPGLTEGELSIIGTTIRSECGEYFEFSRNDNLLTSTKRSDDLWIVISGSFSAVRQGTYVAKVEPGCIIGDLIRLAENYRDGLEVLADRPSAVIRLNGRKLSNIMVQPAQAAAWNHYLALSLANKLGDSNQNFVDFAENLNDNEQLLKRFASKFSLSRVRAYLRGDANRFEKVNSLVWFSDLVGFGDQIAELDPEDVGGVTRKLLQHQSDAVEQAGAHLDKFMGHGLMAYWVEEVDALPPQTITRAVETALEVCESIPVLASNFGLELRIRIGMHLGTAIAGNFGNESRIAHTLVGADVNLAARYEHIRPVDNSESLGPVRISPQLFSHLPADLQGRFSAGTNHETEPGLQLTVHDGPI